MDTGVKVRIDKLSAGVIDKTCRGISHQETTEKKWVKYFGTVTHGLLFGNLGLDESGNPF